MHKTITRTGLCIYIYSLVDVVVCGYVTGGNQSATCCSGRRLPLTIPVRPFLGRQPRSYINY